MSIAAVIHRGLDRAERRDLDAPATLRTDDGRPVDLTIDDLSASGFHISTDLDLTPGEIVTIGIPGIRTHRAEIVRRTATGFGCRFLAPIADEVDRARTAAEPVARPPFNVAAQDANGAAAGYYKLPRRVRLIVLAIAVLVTWLPLVLLYRLLA